AAFTWDEAVQVELQRLQGVESPPTAIHWEADAAFCLHPCLCVRLQAWWVLDAAQLGLLGVGETVDISGVHLEDVVRKMPPEGGVELMAFADDTASETSHQVQNVEMNHEVTSHLQHTSG
ncbi:hypothetical protein XENOCAPTIV_001374, partial [Xenoophorus captivus]